MPTARFNFQFASQTGQVVIDYTHNNVATDADQLDILENDFWAGMRPITSSDVTLLEIVIGDSATGSTRPVNEAGTLAAGSAPSNCAWLITKVVAGARNGRMFWPGVGENQVDAAGQIPAANLDARQVTIDAALAAVDANVAPNPTLSLVVVSNKGTVNEGSEIVNALVLRPTIGTQRRRLR